MKSGFKHLVLCAALSLAPTINAAVVSLSFFDVAMEVGSTTTYSNTGDVWRATDVRLDAGPAMDAIFTFTGATGVSASNLSFSTNVARGNNMRVLMTGIQNAQAFIRIDFVNAGTTTPYTGWLPGNNLIAQFSDLDSDAGNDRSDFAGALTAQFSALSTSGGTSLLDVIADPTYAPDYTVGIMEQPWGPQGNVILNTPEAQSPVTIAFLYNAMNTINIVVGQRSNGSTANRHIDIDMTPDFIIIPEPSSTAIVGIMSLFLLSFRRRSA